MKKFFLALSLATFGLLVGSWNFIAGSSSEQDDLDSGSEATVESSSCNDFHVIRLYIHVIRDSDGNLGASRNKVETMLFDHLYEDFETHKISFSWNGNIHYIDDDDIYEGGIWERHQVAQYDHDDGVDIYVFGTNEDMAVAGEDVGVDSYILIGTGNRDNSDLYDSPVITHEMGHVFNLHHYCVNDANYMAEPCSNENSWNHFNRNQVDTMKIAFTSLPNIQSTLVDQPVVAPSLSKISLTLTDVCNLGWGSATASYDGPDSDINWEWEVLSGSVLQYGGRSIKWTPSGTLTTIRVRATNCRGTTGWKEKEYRIRILPRFGGTPVPCVELE